MSKSKNPNKQRGAGKTYVKRIPRTTGDRKPQNHKSQETDD